MTDRLKLNTYLKESGFETLGDMVIAEPEHSATSEIRRSERSLVVTISTRARDRHGDILDPSGVRLERFRKNPVVLYGHDYDGLPIAKSLWERVRETDTGLELVAKPQFHLDTELSREVWALIEKGILSAWSVGFIPELWEPIGDEQGGFNVKKWDLLEYSSVPVPSNFEALTHALKDARISAPTLVKSLAPLGLDAPDIIPVDVVNCNNDAPPLRGVSNLEENSTAPKESSASSDDVSETPKTISLSPAKKAELIKRAVASAFDEYIARELGK